MQTLDSRRIGFKSLHNNVDTTTPGDMLVCRILPSLAQFKRDRIRERAQVGLASLPPEEEMEEGRRAVLPGSRRRRWRFDGFEVFGPGNFRDTADFAGDFLYLI